MYQIIYINGNIRHKHSKPPICTLKLRRTADNNSIGYRISKIIYIL